MIENTCPRNLTHRVMVGDVAVGGGAEVSVQSMCNTDTADVEATLAQINRFVDAGCEIVRVAIPNKTKLEGFGQIVKQSPIPVVADIHFNYLLAIEACKLGAAGVRINPGNIGSWDKVDAVIEAAKKYHTPIRIGVNGGSLDPKVDEMEGLTLSEKLVMSSVSFVEYFKSKGFEDIVLSAKAHDVPTTLETYRELSRRLPDIPLHLGVTEAGTLIQGTVKSSIGFGILLNEGICDTIRVSLTDDPVLECNVAWQILAALGMRRRSPEIVSCPTCGRCQVNLIGLAKEVDARLSTVKAPISVACMGCVVNGPGEARSADIGVACGKGQGVIFAKGEVIRKVAEDEIVDALFEEIDERF